MAYTRHYWQNGSSGGTPITATTLNEMEDGIEDANEVAGDANATAASAQGVANIAAENAVAAVATADAAEAASAEAVSTANAASAAASNAVSKANAATNTANTAKNTANQALTASAAAQTAAENTESLVEDAAESAAAAEASATRALGLVGPKHVELSAKTTSYHAAQTWIKVALADVPGQNVEGDGLVTPLGSSRFRINETGLYYIEVIAYRLASNASDASCVAIKHGTIDAGTDSVISANEIAASGWTGMCSAFCVLEQDSVIAAAAKFGREVNAGNCKITVRITKMRPTP